MGVMEGVMTCAEVRKKRWRGGTRKKNKESGGCIISVCDGGFFLTPHVVCHGGQMQKVKLNNVHKKWQLPEKSGPSFTEACRTHSN